MKAVTCKRYILGMYLSDSGNIYTESEATRFLPNEKFACYLPILKLWKLNTDDQVVFTDGKNKDGEIETYNSRLSGNRLNAQAIKTKKLDVSHNDLVFGNTNLIINLTRYNVTAQDRGAGLQLVVPVHNTKLEPLTGKLYIITCHTYSNPLWVKEKQGIGNYLQTLYEQSKLSPGPDSDILEYLNEKWCGVGVPQALTVSNTIKVFTMYEITEQDLVNYKTLLVSNFGSRFSLEKIINVPHDVPLHDSLGIGEMSDVLTRNAFNCYIVDNNDTISDRYCVIAGQVKKIEKIKDRNQTSGLYMFHTDYNKKPYLEKISSLDDIDNNPHIFKDAESAKTGADLKTRYVDEVEKARRENEMTRLEAERENLLQKQGLAEHIARLEKEAKERELRHAEEVRQREVKYAEQMAEIKRAVENNKLHNQVRGNDSGFLFDLYKHQHDMRMLDSKSHYQEREYERDSTIETIKTVGAIAGLGLGIWTIASKMNK